jgi:hypothetical protein
MTRRSFAKRVAALVLFWVVQVRAQPSDTFQKAQAEALFQEGRALVASGDCKEAIPKLEASEALETSTGTLLNLGTCYEKLGKTASAWVSYRRAAALARARGQTEREGAARERVKALEPELSYIEIEVPNPAADLELTLDGKRIDPAVYGSAFPVDPGARALVASRPGHVAWRSSVQVPDKRGSLRIEIPALEPVATSEPASPPATRRPAPPRRNGERRPPAGSSQKTWALVAGGVGVVGVGVAGVFSLLAVGKNSDSKEHCDPGDESRCSARGDELRDRARSYADVATVGSVVGALGLGAGVVLWVTAPTGESRWSARIEGSRLSLEKSF